MANITDEHWQFVNRPYSKDVTGVAVEFRADGEWRRHGVRFGNPDGRDMAVQALMKWAGEQGYTLAGPSD